MAFTLHVRFTGLCLFVPDRRQRLMQVLMPSVHLDHEMGATGGEGSVPRGGRRPHAGTHAGHAAADHEGIEPHVVMLAYDGGYETGQGTLFGSLVYRAMEELQLDLSGLADAQLSYALPADVANMTRDGRGGVVRPELLGDDPGHEVASRARLASGRFTATQRGACWRYGAVATRLTNSATWTLEVEAEVLDAQSLRPLRAGRYGQLPELRPIDGEIRLDYFNLPPGDLPPYGEPAVAPDPGTAPHHFRAYFPLFNHAGQPALPRYAPDACADAGPAVARGGGGRNNDFQIMGGSVYTCMVAGGCPDEEGCGDEP